MKFSAYSDNNSGLFDISVKSCGHIFANPGRYHRLPEGRDDFAVLYISKGTEKFYLNSEQIAHAGSFVLFRPGECQSHICINEKKSEFYYIHFSAPESFDFFGLESSRLYTSKSGAEICEMFEEAIYEVQMKRKSYETICVLKLLELLSKLSRKVSDKDNPNSQYMNKIAFVIQNMHREYAKHYTLEDYASMCHMSKYHFLRIFRNITGSTPIDYRNEIRMSHAKELLSETTLTVTEICNMLGYSSAVYFCDMFKKNTGISPSEFRKSEL